MIHIPASRVAIALGLWGLVPFIVPAVCLWLVAPAWQDAFARALVAYAAVILSFLGGIHWGAAVEGEDDPQKIARYTYAICPSLLAVVAILCPPDSALFLLFLGLMAAFFVDRRVYANIKWFVVLRAILTAIASVCLYAGYRAL